jgi:pyridoxine kinase
LARVLAISSQVARGHIGLSAIVPALQRLGHEVWALPTVLLSNHPGHRHAAGTRIEAAALQRMVDALEQNGWLGEVDAVLTGYLPSAAHVAFAAEAVARSRAMRPGLIYLCDPVMGDDPKGLYIEAEAAAAIRDALVGHADIATPNRFELSYLSGASVEDAASAAKACSRLGIGSVLATSLLGADETERVNLLASRDGRFISRVRWRSDAPHGTGDLMAGLLLGYLLSGCGSKEALAQSTAVVDAVLAASESAEELRLTAWAGSPGEVTGWPVERLREG